MSSARKNPISEESFLSVFSIILWKAKRKTHKLITVGFVACLSFFLNVSGYIWVIPELYTSLPLSVMCFLMYSLQYIFSVFQIIFIEVLTLIIKYTVIQTKEKEIQRCKTTKTKMQRNEKTKKATSHLHPKYKQFHHLFTSS